jgi:hypothetical protein
MTEIIVDTAAWKGLDIVSNPRWQFSLEEADIAEIDAALQHSKNLKFNQRNIQADHFPLNIVKTKFAKIAGELEEGCGFVRLRGLPLDRWSREDLELVWMGLSSHLGQPVFQNSDGQLLREIRAESGDVGQRHGQLPTGNGEFLSSRARTASNAELRYHTDRTDIVSLLCTGTASRGGLSKIVSSITVHNEMLARYPDQCNLLYLDLPRSRIGEEVGGESVWYYLPVWGIRDGKFTSHYSRTFIEALEYVPGAPKITSKQWQALDTLAMLAEEQHFEMELAEGDIQFINNHVIYHSRTAFEDDPSAVRQRCLWRIWLSAPHRALPPGHSVLWREVESGKVRGGISLEPVNETF